MSLFHNQLVELKKLLPLLLTDEERHLKTIADMIRLASKKVKYTGLNYDLLITKIKLYLILETIH